MGLRELDLEAATRAEGFDLVLAIRSVHKCWKQIAEWEKALRRAQKKNSCNN